MTHSGKFGVVGSLLSKSAPYVLMEIVLPGGTLCALLLYFYRRGRLSPAGKKGTWSGLSITRMIRTIREQVACREQSGANLAWPRNSIGDGMEVPAILPAR